jgi:hypothetical protein
LPPRTTSRKARCIRRLGRLAGSARLDLNEFDSAFASAWSRIESRFLFLLFDRHTALIHDYGTDKIGFQVGGWLTHKPAVIADLDAIVSALRQQAMPLGQYLTQV